MGRIEERIKKEQYPRREKIAIDVTFKSLKIVVGREARNRKRVPQMESARKINC